MSQLWDAAELFYVSVTPLGCGQPGPLAAAAGGRRGRLRPARRDAGRDAGVSPEAAFHLRNVARLLPVMNDLIDAMEADQGVPVGVPAARTRPSAAAGLREQAQRPGRRPARRRAGAAGCEAGTRRARCPDRRPGRPDRPRPGLRPHAGRRGPGRGRRRVAPTHRGRLWPIEARFLRLAADPGAGRTLAADPRSGSTPSPTASTARASSLSNPPRQTGRPGASIAGCWPRPIGRSPRWMTS